jgi:hypothetical protein
MIREQRRRFADGIGMSLDRDDVPDVLQRDDAPRCWIDLERRAERVFVAEAWERRE